jgi:hypothetical protein
VTEAGGTSVVTRQDRETEMTEPNTVANGNSINGASLNGGAAIAGLAGSPAAPDHDEAQDASSAKAPSAGEPQPAASVAAGPNGSTQAVAQKSADVSVRDIRKNQADCRGEKIDFVFFRRPDYAVYRSGGKILVQYSDNEGTARSQIANTADLLPLRSRLQYLMKDMEAPSACHWQIAEALRLGLDGQREAAKSMMQAAIDDILARRMSKGRTLYLAWAGTVAASVSCAAGAAAVWFLLHRDEFALGLGYLMMATGAGAMGSLLSAAQALRSRAIATDGDRISNAVDSTIRILIGVISAAVLYLILDSNLLAKFSLGTQALPDRDMVWKVALLIGFVAGFLERLVPDLLENKLAPALTK